MPGDTVSEVGRMMRQEDVSALPAVAAHKTRKLVGLITDRDLVIRGMSEGHNPLSTKAKDIMTQKILYCRDSDEILETSLNMTRNKVRRLPVLDENKRLVGIVSLGDMAANSEDYNICGKALGHICAET